MKTLAVASLLLVACTSPSPPKEVGREAAPPVTASVTVEPAATAHSGNTAPADGTAEGVTCGEATCAPGQVCCNASCGICTPPDGACIQRVCEPTADASTAPPEASPPGPSACVTDADCRTHSSYCPEAPCACLALGKSAAAPSCGKPAVNCFVDPCAKKVARCKAGACVLASP